MIRSIVCSRAVVVSLMLALAGCGQMDALFVLEDAPNGLRMAGAQDSDGPKDSGLSKIDDPRVFLESAAFFAEQERDYRAAAAHYAKLVAMEPDNVGFSTRLAANLRVLGRQEDAERILRQGLREHPGDLGLSEELGKTLLASGQLREGVALLERLVTVPETPPARRARIRSAMGVAFDRAGNSDAAREQYRMALKADPLSAPALNNLGLSYAMSGELEAAEATLRQALVTPTAGEQVRQNLAMVLALRGRTTEAERLAGQDLPNEIARDVVAYYAGVSGGRRPSLQ